MLQSERLNHLLRVNLNGWLVKVESKSGLAKVSVKVKRVVSATKSLSVTVLQQHFHTFSGRWWWCVVGGLVGGMGGSGVFSAHFLYKELQLNAS